MGKKIVGSISCAGKQYDGLVPYWNQGRWIVDIGGHLQTYSIDPPPFTATEAKWRQPVVKIGKGFLIAGNESQSDRLVVYEYQRSKGKGKKKNNYRVAHKIRFPVSVGDARLSNMKRLASGNILIAWYEQASGIADCFPRFTYRDSRGNWTTTEARWHNMSCGAPWVSADFTQDTYGDIWYFGHGDSNKNICLIKLRECGDGIEVVSVQDEYINQWDDTFRPEGEHPYIVCEPYEDGVILAYQSRYYKFFSAPTPFVKGAKINLVQIDHDESKELLNRTPDYPERIRPFILAGTTLIYAPINPDTLEYPDLYSLDIGGIPQYFATAIYPYCFGYDDNKVVLNGEDGNLQIKEVK